jgi:hypothetical protein
VNGLRHLSNDALATEVSLQWACEFERWGVTTVIASRAIYCGTIAQKMNVRARKEWGSGGGIGGGGGRLVSTSWRKAPCHCRESNCVTSTIQPVAVSLYTHTHTHTPHTPTLNPVPLSTIPTKFDFFLCLKHPAPSHVSTTNSQGTGGTAVMRRHVLALRDWGEQFPTFRRHYDPSKRPNFSPKSTAAPNVRRFEFSASNVEVDNSTMA